MVKIENQSTRVSDEAVKKLQEELAKDEHEIVKTVELRKGEPDIRQMSEAEYRQFTYRFMTDVVNGMNFMIQSLRDIEIIMLQSLTPYKKEKVLHAIDHPEDVIAGHKVDPADPTKD